MTATQTTAEDQVCLENLTRSPVTLLLDVHTVHLSCLNRVDVKVGSYDRETQSESVQTERRRCPSSLTLWAKGTPGHISAPLHRDVLRATDVQRAIRAHTIRVAAVPTQAAPPAAPAAPAEQASPTETPSETGASPAIAEASAETTPRRARGKES